MARKKRAAFLNQFLVPPPLNLSRGAPVIVIGAGLAGSAAAHALAQAGANVTVLERQSAPATQTSGHPAAVVFPMIAKTASPLRDFFAVGYRAMLAKLQALKTTQGFGDWHQVGAYHLLVNERLKHLWHHAEAMGLPPTWVKAWDADAMEQASQGFFKQPAFEYPTAGYVNPRTLTQAFLAAPGIKLHLHQRAVSLKRLPDAWEVDADGNRFKAQAVILACGLEALRFEQARWLPLRCYRGQLAYVQAHEVATPLSKIICHEGYLVPQADAGYLAGATFHPTDRDDHLKLESHNSLVTQLQTWLPGFLKQAPEMRGRVAFRAQAPDHLPMVGPLPHKLLTERQFQWLQEGQVPKEPYQVVYQPSLFTSLGHASRGTVSCWLAGMLLASLIMKKAGPQDESLLASVNPARFLLRALRKSVPLPDLAMPLDLLPPIL